MSWLYETNNLNIIISFASFLWFYSHLQKSTAPSQKQPIRSKRKVFALSIMFLYALLNKARKKSPYLSRKTLYPLSLVDKLTNLSIHDRLCCGAPAVSVAKSKVQGVSSAYTMDYWRRQDPPPDWLVVSEWFGCSCLFLKAEELDLYTDYLTHLWMLGHCDSFNKLCKKLFT